MVKEKYLRGWLPQKGKTKIQSGVICDKKINIMEE